MLSWRGAQERWEFRLVFTFIGSHFRQQITAKIASYRWNQQNRSLFIFNLSKAIFLISHVFGLTDRFPTLYRKLWFGLFPPLYWILCTEFLINFINTDFKLKTPIPIVSEQMRVSFMAYHFTWKRCLNGQLISITPTHNKFVFHLFSIFQLSFIHLFQANPFTFSFFFLNWSFHFENYKNCTAICGVVKFVKYSNNRPIMGLQGVANPCRIHHHQQSMMRMETCVVFGWCLAHAANITPNYLPPLTTPVPFI